MAQTAIEPAVGERRLRMTYREFLAWSEGEGAHGEWVDGEVTIFLAAKPPHQQIAFLFATVVELYADLHHLGTVLIAPVEMLVRGGRSSRELDVAFVANRHRPRITDDRIDGPADLVLEVISPDSVARDRREKHAEYEQVGVPEYWLMDSRPGRPRTVAAYHLTTEGRYAPLPPDADGYIHSRVLPGFWWDPAWIAEDPFPRPLAILSRIAGDALRRSVALPPA